MTDGGKGAGGGDDLAAHDHAPTGSGNRAPGRILGAVLAGGKSRRYGRPKHPEEVGGVPMIRRALGALEGSVDELVVVSSRPVEGAEGVTVIPDLIAERGPLGGLHAAMHHAAQRGLDRVVLLACDLPLLDADVVARLVRAEAAPVVVPARGSRGVEPLCAVYEVALLPTVEHRLQSDDLSLHALIREAGGRSVELSAHSFLNVNTPADRDRAEAALKEKDGQ